MTGHTGLFGTSVPRHGRMRPHKPRPDHSMSARLFLDWLHQSHLHHTSIMAEDKASVINVDPNGDIILEVSFQMAKNIYWFPLRSLL